MSALSKILRDTEDNGLIFMCPGCGKRHMIKHGVGEPPRWVWNGNAEKPTFSPSILVKGSELTDKGWRDYDNWCEAGHPKRSEPFDSTPTICHSFVTDGRIQFLNDCTHELAGQTVDIPEWK